MTQDTEFCEQIDNFSELMIGAVFICIHCEAELGPECPEIGCVCLTCYQKENN